MNECYPRKLLEFAQVNRNVHGDELLSHVEILLRRDVLVLDVLELAQNVLGLEHFAADFADYYGVETVRYLLAVARNKHLELVVLHVREVGTETGGPAYRRQLPSSCENRDKLGLMPAEFAERILSAGRRHLIYMRARRKNAGTAVVYLHGSLVPDVKLRVRGAFWSGYEYLGNALALDEPRPLGFADELTEIYLYAWNVYRLRFTDTEDFVFRNLFQNAVFGEMAGVRVGVPVELVVPFKYVPVVQRLQNKAFFFIDERFYRGTAPERGKAEMLESGGKTVFVEPVAVFKDILNALGLGFRFRRFVYGNDLPLAGHQAGYSLLDTNSENWRNALHLEKRGLESDVVAPLGLVQEPFDVVGCKTPQRIQRPGPGVKGLCL